MEGSINFGALEELIEDARLNSDWVACKSGLEQYAHIFELPSSYSTSFHADTKAMKAYYWLCMTDSTFYSTGDFDQSVDFLRRAIAIYPTHPDICLILVKILIRSSIQLLQAQLGLTNLQDVTLSSVKFDRSVEHVTLATVLGDRIQELSLEARTNIERFNGELYPMEMDLLTIALACFPTDDIVILCQSFSSFVSTLSIERLTASMILACARQLLRNIDLQSSLASYSQGKLSAYSFWLHTDGLLTCSAVSEALNDLSVAREVLDRLIDPLTISPAPSLPPPVIAALTLARCRRPLISALCQTREKAINELESLFASPDEASLSFASLLPFPLRLAMTIQLVLLYIDRAATTVSNLEELAADLLGAFRYLKYSLYLPFRQPEETLPAFDQGYQVLRAVVAPLPTSNLHYLVRTFETHPLVLSSSSQSTLGQVAVLLAGLMVKLQKKCGRNLVVNDPNNDDYSHPTEAYNLYDEIHQVLVWGMQVEGLPDPLLLYLLARSHWKQNRLHAAIQCLENCHHRLFHTNTAISSGLRRKICDRSIWLGILRLPLATAPHVPVTQCLDLAMHIVDSGGDSSLACADGVLRFQQVLWRAMDGKSQAWGPMFFIDEDIHQASQRVFPRRPVSLYREEQDGLNSTHYQISLEELEADLPPMLHFHLPFPELSEDEALVVGLNLLATLGRLYAHISRTSSLPHATTFEYAYHSARIFLAILRAIDAAPATAGASAGASLKGEALELRVLVTLELAVVLADLRLISSAAERVKAMLSSPEVEKTSIWSSLRARYHHLLVLLLSAQSDNTSSLALAAVFAERTLTTTSTAVSPAATSAEGGQGPENWNLFFTHLLVVWTAGEARQGLALAQALLASIQEHVNPLRWPIPAISSMLAGQSRQQRSRLHSTAPPTYRLPMDVRSIVPMLVGIARISGKMHKLSLAKTALGLAWQCLYALPVDLTSHLTNLTAGNGKIDRYEEADLLRFVPTLLGWRLAEGCGMGRCHDVHAEAEVLAETARVVQLESRDMCDPRAVELYSLALATCPYHVHSLAAMALIHLEKYRGEMAKRREVEGMAGSVAREKGPAAAVEASNHSLATANYFARTALRHGDRYPEAWHVYSLVAEVLVSDAVALDAALAAADCLQSQPVRPFGSIFW